MTPPPATLSAASSQDSNVTGGDTTINVASTTDSPAAGGVDVAQRRQLGERLYPKVQSIQPVSYLLCCYFGL